MSDGIKKIQIQTVIEDQNLKQIEKSIESIIHTVDTCSHNALQVQAIMHLGLKGHYREEDLLCEYVSRVSSEYFSINIEQYSDQMSKYSILNALAFHEKADLEMIVRPDIIFEARSLFRMLSCGHHENTILEPRHTPVETAKEYKIETGETEWASDDCMLIPSDVFHQLHGFDEMFQAYYGDVDLSLRARSMDCHIRYVPGAMVYCPQVVDQHGCLIESENLKIQKNRDRLCYVQKWGTKSNVDALRTALNEMGKIGKTALEQYDNMDKRTLDQEVQDKKKYANFLNMDFCNLRY